MSERVLIWLRVSRPDTPNVAICAVKYGGCAFGVPGGCDA